MTNMPKPRIPAALKKLGVTKLERTTGSVFNLGYTMVGEDSKAEGNAPAIIRAAAAKWPEAEISWPGSQAYAITINFNRHWRGEPMPPSGKAEANAKPDRKASADESAADTHIGLAEDNLRKAIKALTAAGHTNSVETIRAIRRQLRELNPLKGDSAAS